jgi:hypothetical protein
MAYKTPRTWVTNEVVTAAMMNQNVRDNVSEVFKRANTKTLIINVFTEDVLLVANDATPAHSFPIPMELNGAKLINAAAVVNIPSTSGLPEIRVHNLTNDTAMLSTNITIDQNEKTSYTATTPMAINTANDTVTTGQRVGMYVKAKGTDTRGLDVILTFMVQS